MHETQHTSMFRFIKSLNTLEESNEAENLHLLDNNNILRGL